jgi:hypothetical protein
MTRLALVLAASLLVTTAQADTKAAAACAEGLPGEARVIYDDAAPVSAKGGDIKALLTTRVRSLVIAGKVSRGTARTSAEAAGKCLLAAR